MAEYLGSSNAGFVAACVWWFFATVQSTFPTDGDAGGGTGDAVGSCSIRPPIHADSHCERNSRHGSYRSVA